MSIKLDILVFAAHPDDAELACSGTILSAVAQGKKVGIVDFTKGEMGTRGTPELRLIEANNSAKILGIEIRENLGFRDCFFEIDEYHLTEIVKKIRQYKPEVVLANALEDRHPDHTKGGAIVEKAVFLSGLRKLETNQESWRPKKVYHYIQDRMLKPDFVVDITPFYESKIASIKAFESQFYNPDSSEPVSYIATKEFWHFIEARAREFGHHIGKEFGEGFQSRNPIELTEIK